MPGPGIRAGHCCAQSKGTREPLSRLWYDLAGTPFPTQARAPTDLVGTDRLLYGSDYCFTPPPAVADQIASIDTAPAPEPGFD